MSTDPSDRPGLERHDGLDRVVSEDLDRFLLESAVARQDAAAELTRELMSSASLELGDATAALERLEGAAVPSMSELENLLSSPEAEGLRIDANLLTDLLREGVEGQTVLKRGLAFLKHRKYPLALEWWALNRAALDPGGSKLYLLLLIMEALTHQFAGDKERAAACQAKVFAHPLFRGALTRS
jgi:hypothetical protein